MRLSLACRQHFLAMVLNGSEAKGLVFPHKDSDANINHDLT